jgi:methionyl-tRNA formyltransferase
LRTVFIGTAPFAVPVLERLAGTGHRPGLVVTRPDSPQGRGRRLAPPPIAQAASRLGLEVIQPASVNSDTARAQIAAVAPETVCVCAYGALVKEPLLSAYPMLNVHPSLLPRWRGAAPIERAIMAGDERTGVSIMRLTAGLDSGPVCAQAQEPIGPADDYGALSERLALKGAELLVDVLDRQPPCAEQDDSHATYAEKVGPEDRRLDPSRPATELERTVRALNPHIGAWLELPDGTRLGVSEARPEPGGEEPPGALVARDGIPALACAEGELRLLTVKPAGRRAMSGAEWLRGLRV